MNGSLGNAGIMVRLCKETELTLQSKYLLLSEERILAYNEMQESLYNQLFFLHT